MGTACTVSITYGHPLALSDALPSCVNEASVPRRKPRTMGLEFALFWQARLDSGAPSAPRGARTLEHALACVFRKENGFETVKTEKPPGISRGRSEEHTSELQSLMRTSHAVFCLKKKISTPNTQHKTLSHHKHNE